MVGHTTRGFCGWDLVIVIISILDANLLVTPHPLSPQERKINPSKKDSNFLFTEKTLFTFSPLNQTTASTEASEELFTQYATEISHSTLLTSTTTNASTAAPSFATDIAATLFPKYTNDNGLTSTLSSSIETVTEEIVSENNNLEVVLTEEDTDNSKSHPAIQVVTQTLPTTSSTPYSSTLSSKEVVTENKEEASSIYVGVASSTDAGELDVNKTGNGENLHSGPSSGPVEASGEVDIFDHLMNTIHSHWLDFVGKMKLSVLDVWKSISQHMMNRLENFASSL